MDAYFLAIGIMVLVYMLMTQGLNLQYGYCGLINFGQVGFFAIGAYTSALISLSSGLPIVLTVAISAIVAAIAAYPIGAIALRLRDDYFAIVTLGFSETVRAVLQQERWLTNGVQGVLNIPRPFPSLEGVAGDWALCLTLIAGNLVVLAAIRRLLQSPFGRLMRAVRDDEDVLRALGKSPARVKIQVFMIGSALAGIAGAIWAHYLTFISPEQFVPLVTFYTWIAMIIGGTATSFGPIIGALVLVSLLEGSRFIRDLPGFDWISGVQMANLRLGIIGAVLILVMLVRPGGALSRRPS